MKTKTSSKCPANEYSSKKGADNSVRENTEVSGRNNSSMTPTKRSKTS